MRAQDNVKIKALACMYQKTPHTLFYIKNNGIAKPKDLEGKKVAFSPGDSPRLMFPAFAKANGIDESKVSWLSVDPNSKNAMLLNRQRRRHGDLHLHHAGPAESRQGGRRGRRLRLLRLGRGLLFQRPRCVEDYIKAKNPDVTQHFVQATMEGVAFTLANAEEAVAILKKHQPQLDEESALKEVEILRNLISADGTKKPARQHDARDDAADRRT